MIVLPIFKEIKSLQPKNRNIKLSLFSWNKIYIKSREIEQHGFGDEKPLFISWAQNQSLIFQKTVAYQV